MRAYQALLRLLPASFRAEYGGEMCALFARRRREVAGPLSRLVLWVDVGVDVVTTAARVHLDLLGQDLRQVRRAARRAPGFVATVVAVSALGVGATTAAFSIADHVLVRPLPFPGADRLVQLWQSQAARGYGRVELSPANYRDWRRLGRSFEAMGAFHPRSYNLRGAGDPLRLSGAALTAEVLPLLGTKPLVGRVFAPDDDREGASGRVVLSYELWQGRFGGDPGILGRQVVLDDATYDVIGVMPRGFHFPGREARLWTALRLEEAAFAQRDDLWIYAVARLAPGVSRKAAQAEMALVAAQLETAHPVENPKTGAEVVALRDQVSPQARLLLLALGGASACVLLIACANLAGLYLARGLERRQELAVRAALGAGRERLVRQLLTESLTLAGLGGVLGVGLAFAALPLVARLVPTALPIAEAPPLDLRVLAVAGLATLVVALGFAVAPAWRSLQGADADGLREGARAGRGGRRERFRAALVTAEVAVSVVLLVSSGLLIRALGRLHQVDPGFRAEGVVTLRTALPMPKYAEAARRTPFYTSVLEEVRALPGVTNAAYISYLPMVMGGGIWAIEAEGQPAAPGEQTTASLRYVTPGYFATLGIPLRRGRDVTEADTEGSLKAAVVSESFAARYRPGEDPLGRRFRFGLLGSQVLSGLGAFQERTVVGVVGDVKVRGIERRSEPQVYLPYRQHPDGMMGFYVPKDLAVRSTSDPGALVPALRRIVARADPDLPVSDVRTLGAILDEQTASRRTQVFVLGGFAALAVLLAAVGLHGLLAFAVTSRAQEIGVRLALGASPMDILRLVLRQALTLGAAGGLTGLLLSGAAGRWMQGLLAGVSPFDPSTFLAAAGVAALTVLAGSLRPTLHALRVDPLTVLRAD